MRKLIALLLALSILAAFAGCTPKEVTEATESAPEPVPLSQALQNTWDAITKGKTFTVTVDGKMTDYYADVENLPQGTISTISGDLKIALDMEEKQLSMYGQAITDGEMVTAVVHDGWAVFFDYTTDEYSKSDVSEELNKLFEDNEEDFDLTQILSEEDLELVGEVLDLEKALELLKEKFSDPEQLKEAFNYSTTVEGATVIHTFRPDLFALLCEALGSLEDAFEDEDIYEEIMDELEDMQDEVDDGDVVLQTELTLTQTGDIITKLDLNIIKIYDGVENDIDLSVTISDIGTTELDLEMLDEILDELEEWEEEPDFFGQVDGQSYVNEYIGIAADFSSDWVVATPEEAAELMGMTGMGDSFENLGISCDLYTLNSDGRSTINIMLQESNFAIRNMSEEEFMESNQESVKTSLGASGFKNIKSETVSITFAGQERNALKISGTLGDSTVFETMVVIRTDDYIYIITATTTNTDRTEEFLSIFTEA